LGGVIEFNPTLQLRDSLVFYWRVAKKPDTGQVTSWAGSSFTYLSKSGEGWSQSHYYQNQKNIFLKLNVDSSRKFVFENETNFLRINTGFLPVTSNNVYINTDPLMPYACLPAFGSFEMFVIDQRTNKPFKNSYVNNKGRYNSDYYSVCTVNSPYQFWYSLNNANSRKNAMGIFDSIPIGSIIGVMATGNIISRFDNIDVWKSDTLLFGKNNSIYHKLKSVGFTMVDSLTKRLPFCFVAKKISINEFQVLAQRVGQFENDRLNTLLDYISIGDDGEFDSPIIGPSHKWDAIHWNGNSLENNSSDKFLYSVYGVDYNFNRTLLYTSTKNRQDTSISFIDKTKYPYLLVSQKNADTLNNSPWQQRYLQVKFDPMPEGGLNKEVSMPFKDSLDVGEPYRFNMSFKNISTTAFDSVKTLMLLTDASNTTRVIVDEMKRPIKPGDTILLDKTIDTRNLIGDNSVFVNFNPENVQPEQYLFNNYHGRNFYVKPDNYAPNLDVTFDGLHILNRDIISPKPTIIIKLKDDSRFLALNDTSLFSIKLRYPDGSLRNVKFDNDTLQFTPSSNPLGGNNNTASILYKPFLTEDGEYELIITAKDRSNNLSGALDYSVVFQVINKSMITNLLNYPNPFTTSTSFVFTLTGSQIPSHFRIQIMTITGKIVKEINKEELGPLKIGHNITEYKWDGKDQFGQNLANGVYLYRVMTDINGKKLDKLKSGNFNTEKYFQGGYGKMYLMR